MEIRSPSMSAWFARAGGTLWLAALVFAAPTALGHDVAEAPHMNCEREDAASLRCLYHRHPVTPTQGRPFRAGYADKGLYTFSCSGSGEDMTFTTSVCRAGTGDLTRFSCWTREEKQAIGTLDCTLPGARRHCTRLQQATELESVTQWYVFDGKPLQETMLKFLTNPAAAGRRHFLANDNVTAREIASFAGRCELDTAGGLTLQDVAALLPFFLRQAE